MKRKLINDVLSDFALQQSKSAIENIFSISKDAIITVNLLGDIKIINREALELLGFMEDEVKGMKIWNIVCGWDNIMDGLMKKPVILNEDIEVNIKKNKVKLNINVYANYDSNMRISEVFCLLKDIEKTRKLKERLLSGKAIYSFDKIIGKSKGFLDLIEYSKKIADSKSTILITGESGTGKEVFTQAIHNYSIRRDKPFVAVNCGAIPRNLIESELFGYEEGSFTGAKKGGYAGKFEIANGGTIFLDEIGEMPMDMQIKLLRVIEEGIINRIGSSKQIPINCRIITATNKDLKEEVEKGNFRKDLFYRINVLPLNLPALRERKEDIPLLLEYFMNKTSKHLNKRKVDISPEFMEKLVNYNWPGNIRELDNMVELIINTESTHIFGNMQYYSCSSDEKINDFKELDLNLETVEKEHIKAVLNKFGGNISSTAKALGIGRSTLYKKIEKYSL